MERPRLPGPHRAAGYAAIDPATREGAVDAGEPPVGYYTLTLHGTVADEAPVARTAGFAVQHPGPDPKRTTDSFFGVNHGRHRRGPDRSGRDRTEVTARAVTVDTQFPQWAGLPLKLLDRAGSDHVIHRPGEELSVRLPRHPGAMGQARKEAARHGALGAPGWDRPPVWFHGDLHTGNLLTTDGRLGAVIDFGELGIGDPSCDLTVAFTLMPPEPGPSSATCWAWTTRPGPGRRGWAPATGLTAYTAYAAEHPRGVAQTTSQITEALIG